MTLRLTSLMLLYSLSPRTAKHLSSSACRMKLVVEVSLWDNFSTARSINSISSTKNGIVKVSPCFTLDLSFADSVFGVMVKVARLFLVVIVSLTTALVTELTSLIKSVLFLTRLKRLSLSIVSHSKDC